MSATAAMIAELRRMVNEPDDTTYGDTLLTTIIERYPALDERGEVPYTWDTSTSPPTQVANDGWIPTYDLHRAAADIWEEKAAAVAGNYQFSADGGSYSRNQVYEQYIKTARRHLARAKAKSARAWAWPPQKAAALTDDVIGNLAEDDDR